MLERTVFLHPLNRALCGLAVPEAGVNLALGTGELRLTSAEQ